MELKVQEYQTPQKITFNFEEIKMWLSEKVSQYETLVYTDEQMKLAKKDKADLNKLSKALNDERIRLERKYLEPFNEFKAQINQLREMIDTPVKAIDNQIREFEELEKQKKYEEIKAEFDSLQFPEFVTIDRVFNSKWLNKSVSMKSVTDLLTEQKAEIEKNLSMLSDLPDFGFEAVEVYKQTLDLQKSIGRTKEMSEIAKRKAEEEERKKKEEEVTVKAVTLTKEAINVEVEYKPQREWVSFSAYLSREEAQALKDFFTNHGIEFKAVSIKRGQEKWQ